MELPASPMAISLHRIVWVLALLAATVVATVPASADEQGSTTRVSVASDGTQGNKRSNEPSLSADGRYVAFSSNSSNLVADDTNPWSDVFVHDRETGTTTRVSVASDRTQGNDASSNPSINADGRYVVFSSNSSNLVADDTNQWSDVFVHDRETGTTTRVSVASDGTQGSNESRDPSISADGRYVAFSSSSSNLVGGDTNRHPDVFVHDRETETTTHVSVASNGSPGKGASGSPSISADGRYVAFWSYRDDLVAGGRNDSPRNPRSDVFVHDTHTGKTSHVSVASNGSLGNRDNFEPSIGADGRYVAFSSLSSNLVAADTNGQYDVFVHDTHTGTTTRVSVASDGTPGNDASGNPSISADGRYVVFSSNSSNLVVGDTNRRRDVFVRAIMLCSDGLDNDGDGTPDHPGDAGCSSGNDLSEGSLLRRDSTTTIRYRNGAFRGRVASDARRCVADRTVWLKKARPGRDRTVDRTKTGPRGHWKIARANPDGRYYAVIFNRLVYNEHLDTIACGWAKSRLISV
ncbi:MAG: TolB family protein [Actinomycetota bacterium]